MKKVTITINSDDFEMFKDICVKNGYKISTRISLLIRKDIETYLSREKTKPKEYDVKWINFWKKGL